VLSNKHATGQQLRCRTWNPNLVTKKKLIILHKCPRFISYLSSAHPY
jgi:hypothetical protein